MRTDSAEVVCGGEGEVKLEATGQKQDSVDRSWLLPRREGQRACWRKTLLRVCRSNLREQVPWTSVAESEAQVKI